MSGKQFPTPYEVVRARVKNFVELGCYVELVDYNNKVVFSEPHKILKVGHIYDFLVLRTTSEHEYADLSYRGPNAHNDAIWLQKIQRSIMTSSVS